MGWVVVVVVLLSMLMTCAGVDTAGVEDGWAGAVDELVTTLGWIFIVLVTLPDLVGPWL